MAVLVGAQMVRFWGPGRAGLIDLMALGQESELCCCDRGAEGAQVAAQAGGGGPGDLALRQALVVRLNQLLVLLDLLGFWPGGPNSSCCRWLNRSWPAGWAICPSATAACRSPTNAAAAAAAGGSALPGLLEVTGLAGFLLCAAGGLCAVEATAGASEAG